MGCTFVLEQFAPPTVPCLPIPHDLYFHYTLMMSNWSSGPAYFCKPQLTRATAPAFIQRLLSAVPNRRELASWRFKISPLLDMSRARCQTFLHVSWVALISRLDAPFQAEVSRDAETPACSILSRSIKRGNTQSSTKHRV